MWTRRPFGGVSSLVVTVTVSGHTLAMSHDCRTDGCTKEGVVQLGSLWYCDLHGRSGAPVRAETSPAGACKQPGCEKPIHKRSGPYGGLCVAHTEEARQARRSGSSGEAAIARLVDEDPPALTPAALLPQSSYEFRVRALVGYAVELDEAGTALQVAQERYATVLGRWRAELGKLEQPAGQLDELRGGLERG
jgi:hypothetical protein